MDQQLLPYLFLLVTAVLVSTVLLPIAVRNRRERGAVPLIGLLLGTLLWAATDAALLVTSDLERKLVVHNVRFMASGLVPIAYFLLIVEYTNREQLITRWRVLALSMVSLLTIVSVWTGVGEHLIRADAELVSVGSSAILQLTWGPWFWLFVGFNYLLLLIATFLLVMKLRDASVVGIHRKQVLTMLVAGAVPWFVNVTYTSGLSLIDLTAVGFTITGLMLVIALFHYRFFDVTPIARSTVVETMDDACLVLSKTDHVVDVNQRAATMLGEPPSTLVGQPITSVFEAHSDQLDRFIDSRDVQEQITVEIDAQMYHFDVDVSPVHNAAGQYLGRTVLIHDVTDRVRRHQVLERQKAKLEAQNERLDEFASVVSHDLRNPIAVIEGYLAVARAQTEADLDAHDEIEWATDRMQTLIDDVLALAREERDVVEPRSISLETIASAAWQSVHTETASLVIETECHFEGDPSRLRQAFENLFRNAVEHGSTSHADADASADAVEHGSTSHSDATASKDAVEHGSTSQAESGGCADANNHGADDVTVTVGVLDGDTTGFFVEDDGPGIPPAERDAIFDRGYTTSSEGTGFGLAIVERTIDAHGWSLSVTTSQAGGARFEVTGVDVVEEGDGESVHQSPA